METIYTVRGIGLTGRNILKLCRRLSSRGLDLDGVEYTVYNFHTNEVVSKVKYDQTSDSWFKNINGRWILVISTTKKNGQKDLRQ